MRTLHEAIKEVIKKLGPIKAKQVAWILNHSDLYHKKDLSEIQTSQIYARIHNYPDMLYLSEDKLVCVR